ncbi:hypothetical protein RYX36_022688 [Vicia faba]
MEQKHLDAFTQIAVLLSFDSNALILTTYSLQAWSSIIGQLSPPDLISAAGTIGNATTSQFCVCLTYILMVDTGVGVSLKGLHPIFLQPQAFIHTNMRKHDYQLHQKIAEQIYCSSQSIDSSRQDNM